MFIQLLKQLWTNPFRTPEHFENFCPEEATPSLQCEFQKLYEHLICIKSLHFKTFILPRPGTESGADEMGCCLESRPLMTRVVGNQRPKPFFPPEGLRTCWMKKVLQRVL